MTMEGLGMLPGLPQVVALTTGELWSRFHPQPLHCSVPDFTPSLSLTPQLCL